MTTAVKTGWLRSALVGLALFGAAGTAAAQGSAPTAASITLARQLIELKGGNEIYNPIFINVIQKAKYALLQSNPMLQKDLDDSATKVAQEVRPELEALKNEAAKMYASHFTERELQQVLAFYKSPLGAKLIATEPKVLGQSMRYAQTWAARLSDEVLLKLRQEMRKRGHEM